MKQRPPCAIMGLSTAIACESKVAQKFAAAGFELVIVADVDVPKAMRMAESIRGTKAKLFNLPKKRERGGK